MRWPYQFLNLDETERHVRRQVLDRYAGYAQLSAVLPVALFLLYRIASWAAKAATARHGSYDPIPNSPSLKVQRQSMWGVWGTQIQKLKWWLGDDVYLFGQLRGQRDQWIFGTAWTIWLLFLCVAETGQDYLHLTKRFGIIAASQFPVQYLLALKSLNPFAYVFKSSHEQINRLHRPLGRIIYVLLCLHAALYVNYFIGVGILGKRLLAPIVAAGVVAFICMSLISATALRSIRQFSYRVFFVIHIISILILPPLLFFHARPARLFMTEAFVIFIVDLISRKLDTVISQASLESIPGTSLVKVTASIPYHKINRFRAHPGSHIYLSVPAAARPSSNPASDSFLIFEFLFNPFTVAAVDDETGDLTLVARRCGGPLTSALARFAAMTPTNTSTHSTIVSREEGKIPLGLEGPYGIAKYFPNLSGGDFARVLLVAGGIGATFTVPLYKSIVQDNANIKVEMVWAVRGAGDATWSVTGMSRGKGVMDDENVHIFLTGDILESDDSGGGIVPTSSKSRGSRTSRANGSNGEGSSSMAGDSAGDGEVEMSSMYRDRKQNRYTSQHNRKRPDLKKIVDDTFKHGADERIAVVVCGPDEMTKELRNHVGVWVMKGRSVFFHNEGFGW